MKFSILLTVLVLTSCKSQFNDLVDPESVQVSGDSMTGSLTLPSDGLTVGTNQIVASGGYVGIGTSSPGSQLTVSGVVESTSGGIKFPDGSVQTSAAGTSCFGGVCVGDTIFSGRSTFSGLSVGAGIADAALYINPSSASANDVLMGIAVGGVEKFRVDQEGDLDLLGAFDVGGAITAASTLDVTGAVSAASTLAVTGAMTAASTLGVTGAITAGSSLGVTGPITGSSTLGISGAVTAGSTLGVTGAITAGSSLGVTGAITGASTLDITGAVTAGSTLGVTGALTAGSTLNVTGAITAGSTLAVTGAMTAASTLDVTGALSTASNLSVGGNLGVTGALNLSSTLSCTGCVTSTVISDGAIATADLADSSVTIAKISSGTSGQVLQTNESNEAEWMSPQVQYGIKFEYIDVSSIRLNPAGIHAKASIIVSDGTDVRSAVISSPLTVNITVSGAGGLDTGIEAANTGYDVRLITEDEGANPALLLTVSGDSPDLPGSYTFQSEVLWFISNTQGGSNDDIAEFVDISPGRCLYLIDQGVATLIDGEQTSTTAIDLSEAVPSSASTADLFVIAQNAATLVFNVSHLEFYTDSGGSNMVHTIRNLLNLTTLINARSIVRERFSTAMHSGPANSLFYKFSTNPGLGVIGLDSYVQGWSLPYRMGQ